MNKLLLPSLLLLVLCGCFKTKDELTLNADGSGSVRLETRVLVPSETLSAIGLGARMSGGDDIPAVYPPTSEAEAKQWFPAKDFILSAKQEAASDGGSSLVITAGFKDITESGVTSRNLIPAVQFYRSNRYSNNSLVLLK